MADYRILVTGSRTWNDAAVIREALRDVITRLSERASGPYRRVVVIHGAAMGADSLAGLVAQQLGIAVERHPAGWQQHGRAAGFLRNAEMVAAGADLCLAFIKDHSRGAAHCADLAERAGIPVRRYTS